MRACSQVWIKTDITHQELCIVIQTQANCSPFTESNRLSQMSLQKPQQLMPCGCCVCPGIKVKFRHTKVRCNPKENNKITHPFTDPGSLRITNVMSQPLNWGGSFSGCDLKSYCVSFQPILVLLMWQGQLKIWFTWSHWSVSAEAACFPPMNNEA